jgi:hypothetical protein
MPRYRHVIYTRGGDLPGHLARTYCGRIVAYGRQPNVPRGDARFCARCHALDETTVSRAPIDLVVGAPVMNRRVPHPKKES